MHICAWVYMQSVPTLCDLGYLFFIGYVYVHTCEIYLFLLCESWDMSLFVCEVV